MNRKNFDLLDYQMKDRVDFDQMPRQKPPGITNNIDQFLDEAGKYAHSILEPYEYEQDPVSGEGSISSRGIDLNQIPADLWIGLSILFFLGEISRSGLLHRDLSAHDAGQLAYLVGTIVQLLHAPKQYMHSKNAREKGKIHRPETKPKHRAVVKYAQKLLKSKETYEKHLVRDVTVASQTGKIKLKDNRKVIYEKSAIRKILDEAKLV